MKILHVTECLGSGVLNYVKNLAAWQVEEHEVYVAYATRPETPENFKEQFDSRVHFIYVEGFTREIRPVNDLKAFMNVKKIVKEIQPDLIHLHSTKAGIIGRWSINCNRYNVLYSPHAYSFQMMDCSERKRKLYQFIERISDKKRCTTVTISGSEFEASKAVTQNAICIASGINTKEMDSIIEAAAPLVEPRTNTTICMMGKAVPQKNPGLFNEIAAEFPNVDFVWIGAGPLENMLTSPNITITGWLDRIHATAKVMESDIFLFPTAWEGLSIALLEVMYIGKPCVVSTADGNRDVISTGHNGYVCVTKQDYIDAIEQLLNSKEMISEYGSQARNAVVEKYNVEVMEQNYKEFFRHL